jgi:hypothetical protein
LPTRLQFEISLEENVERKENSAENVKDLTLLLMYLTGWQEDSKQNPGEKVFRSWDGYGFKIIDELVEDKLIFHVRQAKSVFFTEKGKKMIEALKSKYLC